MVRSTLSGALVECLEEVVASQENLVYLVRHGLIIRGVGRTWSLSLYSGKNEGLIFVDSGCEAVSEGTVGILEDSGHNISRGAGDVDSVLRASQDGVRGQAAAVSCGGRLAHSVMR